MKIFTFLKSKPIAKFLQNVLSSNQFNTFLLCVLVLFGTCSVGMAQIQWATRVQTADLSGMPQAQNNLQGLLGMPDVVPSEHLDTKASTIYFQSHTDKVNIELEFDVPIPVLKVFIAENFGVGLKEIALKDEQGRIRSNYAVNENYDMKLGAKIAHATLYQPTDFLVKSIVITIYAPFNGKNACQIDGVGISTQNITLDYNFDGKNYSLPTDLEAKTLKLNNVLAITTNKKLTKAELKNETAYFPYRTVSKYTLKGKFFEDTTQVKAIKLLVVNQKNQDSLLLTTEDDGSFQVGLDEADYLLIGFQTDYLTSKAQKISTYGRKIGDVFHIDVPISTFKQGENYVFSDFSFDINADSLDQSTLQTINRVFSTLQENPQAKVRIEVHTDSRGDDQYNLELSERRAKVIADYLLNKGISPQQFVCKGMGETELRNHCANGVRCDNVAHKENRRIEIEIVGLLPQK
jgi:outer membrane protein OmpA-like peptidoglycan-associated protein